MERRENARDGSTFYGCSNWPYCEHRGRPCPKCGTGLPIRSGSAFRCRDCGGSIESCPSCGGWLESRMSKFGRFLGCSNFPECDYTRNLRRSVLAAVKNSAYLLVRNGRFGRLAQIGG